MNHLMWMSRSIPKKNRKRRIFGGKSRESFFFNQNFTDPPFGGIFCKFLYKTYKDCEINIY